MQVYQNWAEVQLNNYIVEVVVHELIGFTARETDFQSFVAWNF